MPRGVEFTAQQRSVLRQMLKTSWARHKGKEPKMTRRLVNPRPKQAGKGYAPGEAVIFRDEVTGRYRKAKILRKEVAGRQVSYVLDIDYGRIALPSQLRRANPGEAWHQQRYYEAIDDKNRDPKYKDFFSGVASAHERSRLESEYLGMPNPRPKRMRKPKLSDLVLPAAIVGAIVWFARKSPPAPGPW